MLPRVLGVLAKHALQFFVSRHHAVPAIFVCGAERNYTGYCNAEVDKLVEQQSMQADPEKRKKLGRSSAG